MGDDIRPLVFEWDGDHMVPLSPKAADAQYVVHERYVLAPLPEGRDMRSHRHYFAALREAWKNLPEELSLRFPTPEALRKWALITTGWYHLDEIVCASPEEAARAAMILRPRDDFAVVTYRGNVVQRLTARSQATRGQNAMGKEDFQKSKWDVLNKVADTVGISVDELRSNAGRAA